MGAAGFGNGMLTPSFDFSQLRPAEGFRSLFSNAKESAKETAADAVLAAQVAKADADIALDKRQIRLAQEQLGPAIYEALLEDEKDLPAHVKQLFEQCRYAEVEPLAQQLSQMQAEIRYLQHSSNDIKQQQQHAEDAILRVEIEERNNFLLYDQITKHEMTHEQTNFGADSAVCHRQVSLHSTALNAQDITKLRIADERVLAEQTEALFGVSESDQAAIPADEVAKGVTCSSLISVDAIKQALQLRRAEEKEMMLEASDKEPDESWFLVSSNWLKNWQKFTSEICNGDPPGAITNDELIGHGGAVNRELVVEKHYRAINGRAWKKLVQVYGGGPSILADRIDISDARVLL